MKHLALTSAILVFALSSCQKPFEDNLVNTEPEAPAILQSIIQTPDNEKFLLTKIEETSETNPSYGLSYQFQYTPRAC